MLSYNNKARVPIANPPNSAQLDGTPYHSPKSHLGPCSSVGIGQTDRHTHTHTHTHSHTHLERRAWPNRPIYISLHLRLTRNVTT